MDETEGTGPAKATDALDEAAVQQTAVQTEPEAIAEEPELAHHPGPRQYVGIAVILAFVTALEVGAYYVHIARAAFIGLLLFLAAIKFTLVVLWFMHLRFDSRIFQRLFLTGLILAISVYLIVLTVQKALPWGALAGLVAVFIALPVLWFALRRRRQPLLPPEQEAAARAAAHG
jgi:cytochrome c oxidase subunit 4